MEFGKHKYLSNIYVPMKNIFTIYDDLSYLVKKDQVNNSIHEVDLVDFIRARIDFFSSSALKVKSKFIFKSSKNKIILNHMIKCLFLTTTSPHLCRDFPTLKRIVG